MLQITHTRTWHACAFRVGTMVRSESAGDVNLHHDGMILSWKTQKTVWLFFFLFTSWFENLTNCWRLQAPVSILETLPLWKARFRFKHLENLFRKDKTRCLGTKSSTKSTGVEVSWFLLVKKKRKKGIYADLWLLGCCKSHCYQMFGHLSFS